MLYTNNNVYLQYFLDSSVTTVIHHLLHSTSLSCLGVALPIHDTLCSFYWLYVYPVTPRGILFYVHCLQTKSLYRTGKGLAQLTRSLCLNSSKMKLKDQVVRAGRLWVKKTTKRGETQGVSVKIKYTCFCIC